ILRRQNICTFCLSPPNSANISYQSTWPSWPNVYDCGTKISRWIRPIFSFFSRTYARTVASATSMDGFSTRSRLKMRRAVCRCLRGAFRSVSRIVSMKAIAGSSFGRTLSTIFRSFGTASASASRTMRRWIPSFRATPLMVPTPNWYSRRIASNSSTSFLLFKTALPSGQSPETEYPVYVLQGAKSDHQSGPNDSTEVGQFRLANSLEDFRVRSLKAIARWIVLVVLAHTLLTLILGSVKKKPLLFALLVDILRK